MPNDAEMRDFEGSGGVIGEAGTKSCAADG